MKIQTVRGEISPTDLGATSCHEHVLWTVPEPYAMEDPDLGFDSIPAAVAELRYLKSCGGNALVEMTTQEIGRAPTELKQISIASQIHIIAATGHHKDKFNQSVSENRTSSEMADAFIRDIHLGMDNTSIKAGVIKAATSQDQATHFEEKVITAAAKAHLATGAPVSTHTEGGTFALEQAGLLINAGVNPGKLLIGHLDRNLAWKTYLELAQIGVYLGFDQIGKEKYWPDSERVSLIEKLLDAGYASQMMLSTDSARKSSWHTHNPQAHGPAYLYESFLPALKNARIEESDIRMMTIENPARFLAF
ncbi:MAG: phosphotriesterase family protein [Anaerolineaceae bacterium]